MRKMRRFLAMAVAGAMLFSVPVFGADENVLEFEVTPIESDEILISEDAALGNFAEEEFTGVVADEVAYVEEPETVSDDTAVTEEPKMVTDEVIVEAEEPEQVLGADTTIAESIEGCEAVTADGASSFVYYSQYAYQCNDGYNVIAVYIKDGEGNYKSRLFFVYESEYGEWVRYDYTEMSAQTFLSNYEAKDSNGVTLYIPVVKQTSGKNTFQKNNPKTEIDESKIPVLAEADVTDINYAWKSLSEIPFVKNGEAYEYAGEKKAEPEPPAPTPTPTPVPGEKRSTSTEINGSKYEITWSATVQYDGRAHVWNQTKISPKNEAKQVGDIFVEVKKDGDVLDASSYTVACKNNTNVTGYNNNKKYQPYLTISLKKPYNKDSSKMSKGKLLFDIVPCPVTSGKFQAKKVVIQGTKATFTNLYFVFGDGRKVKLTVYNEKKQTGTFSAVATDVGNVQITGYNNLSGSGLLSMESPKKVTYEW
ncbi:hypothetical protein IKG48_02960 [Candidatus Saccharibacteria bacterium]|nr:hypothetical protein [Candidatus Saccharibacteria bacterium]